MLTEKFKETVRRMNTLAIKADAGEITDEERKELSRLRKAVDAATAPEPVATTRITTMTLAEFLKWVEDEMEALKADADDQRAKLVQRNLANVKAQGKTQDDDMVGVEVMIERSESDRIGELERQLLEQGKLIEDLRSKLDTSKDDDAAADSDDATDDQGDSQDADAATDDDAGDDDADQGDSGDQSDDDAASEGDDQVDKGDSVDWNGDLAPAKRGGNEDYRMSKTACQDAKHGK